MIFNLYNLLFSLIPVIIAITVHEYFHAFTAVRLGDYTPVYEGRLSLNPLRHIDLVGFLMFIFTRFGWAKPVRVNPSNFRNPRAGMRLVALAGPLSNFGLAIISALLIKLLLILNLPMNSPVSFVIRLLYLSLILNVTFAIFNLMPVPPLDGGQILITFLPPQQVYRLTWLYRYGIFILMGILLIGYIAGFNIFWLIAEPIINFIRFLIRI